MRAAGNMRMLSIIIPSYNSESTIAATLTGIRCQSRKDIVSEVIVVDSSDDQTTKSIISRHLSDGDRLITAGVRVMPAISRNIGAEHATGDVLAFIDSDTIPAPDWTERLLEYFQNGRLAGGGSISLPDFQKKRFLPAAQYYLQLNEFMDWGHARVKKFVPSCNLFCDRTLFEKSGGFPIIRTAEDVVFGLRVSKRVPVWFIPEMKVCHVFREDLKGFLKNELILGKGNFRYRRLQYPHTFYYRGIWPMLFLPGFTAIKLARICFRVFRTGLRPTFRFFMAFPAFLLGLLFWTIGFARGVFIYED